MTPPADLDRFVDAQDAGGTYRQAVAELRSGRKTSHWMWFVFPQVAGLGSSAMSQRYALSGVPEAAAYVAHPVLGPRLLQATGIVAGMTGTTAERVLGPVDAAKLRSCMTLFLRAAPDEPVFARVLDDFFDGTPDPLTDGLIRR